MHNGAFSVVIKLFAVVAIPRLRRNFSLSFDISVGNKRRGVVIEKRCIAFRAWHIEVHKHPEIRQMVAEDFLSQLRIYLTLA
jgi:hypothetical protein